MSSATKASGPARQSASDGSKAPAFSLPGADGSTISSAGLAGKPYVLYFYPKDDTSGCTQEAKDFSELAGAFARAGARVVGVSPDSVARHRKFIDKYGLAVELAADEDHLAAEAYGVWVEKSMYGRKYMGVERSTFLIDKAGNVARSWRKVKVPGHAQEVLAALAVLKSRLPASKEGGRSAE